MLQMPTTTLQLLRNFTIILNSIMSRYLYHTFNYQNHNHHEQNLLFQDGLLVKSANMLAYSVMIAECFAIRSFTSKNTSNTHLKLIIITILSIFQIDCTNANFKSEFTYTPDEGFPIGKDLFGQIVGIDVDKNNNVILFHRGTHIWNVDSFDDSHIFQEDRDKPIKETTIVTIDLKQNKFVNSWGSDLFYMPHGLSLDLSGDHVWLTDVALHQVFKYTIDGTRKILELGTRFIPGDDETHFCKPTSVADTGDFVFVADGYCNARIVMFTSDGLYVGQFGHAPSSNLLVTRKPTFQIPHKVVYNNKDRILCVADRENGRIQCFNFEPKNSVDSLLDHDVDERGRLLNGAITTRQTIINDEFNGRLFSIDYSSIRGGVLVAVSGQSLFDKSRAGQTVKGFVYNMTTGQLLSRFEPPPPLAFGMAHDLALSNDDCQYIYVAEASPVNLWRFSRSIPVPILTRANNSFNVETINDNNTSRAASLINSNSARFSRLTYLIVISVCVSLVILIMRRRGRFHNKHDRGHRPPLHQNTYPSSINSLFGVNRSGIIGQHRFNRALNATGRKMMRPAATLFSRTPFYNLFERRYPNNNEFSRIPFEDSDRSDGEHSDSDVEEFNINQATNPNNDPIDETLMMELKKAFMDAYDNNRDGRIDIRELAQLLPIEESFKLVFNFENKVDSSVEFMRIWTKYDTDSSGAIDANELKNFLRDLIARNQEICREMGKCRKLANIGEEKLEEYTQTLLKIFDSNKDGKLQLSEMTKMLLVKENFLRCSGIFDKSSKKLDKAAIESIFQSYDTDRNGVIENEELKGFIKDLMDFLGKIPDSSELEDFERVVMEGCDSNSDGKINKKELTTVLLALAKHSADQEANSEKDVDGKTPTVEKTNQD